MESCVSCGGRRPHHFRPSKCNQSRGSHTYYRPMRLPIALACGPPFGLRARGMLSSRSGLLAKREMSLTTARASGCCGAGTLNRPRPVADGGADPDAEDDAVSAATGRSGGCHCSSPTSDMAAASSTKDWSRCSHCSSCASAIARDLTTPTYSTSGGRRAPLTSSNATASCCRV